MATIYIENKPYTVKDHQNLLHVCLSLGFDLPYFCWHPAMHSVGACRQCAVKLFKDEKDTRGKIVMACMTLAKDGARISINDPEAKMFRAGITEFLMTQHPHDCPVCDEGGECHLQDMTVMTGHVYRGYRFKKRTHRNQYLGPFLNHEMNRCIACYRCVRFYCDYAGGRDLNVMQCNNRVYFGRHEDGALENVFSGNLAEVCPTGVFTDKTFKAHFTRKWDLQTAPSICVHCSLGCNTLPGEHDGVLRRIRNRYNGEVNGYFLCDRGRFGYEFVNGKKRIRHPLLRDESGRAIAAEPEAALQRAAGMVENARGIIGIGSPRASLESNFALRNLVGRDNFFAGIPAGELEILQRILEIMRGAPWLTPSLREVALSDSVFIVGEDVSNTAPMMALALRQSILRKEFNLAKNLHIEPWDDAAFREAIQQECGPLFIATPAPTWLDGAATRHYRGAPDDIARLCSAVARELDGAAPEVPGLSEEEARLAAQIARSLEGAAQPLIVSGAGCGSLAVVESATNAARALWAGKGEASLGFVLPECNSMGLSILGGGSLDAARDAIASGDADTALILENDLFMRGEERAVGDFLAAAKQVLALDHTFSRTVHSAGVVLPAATFAEASGTLVNNECRAQRFYGVMAPGRDIRAGWRWIGDIVSALGKSGGGVWNTLDDIKSDMAAEIPGLKEISRVSFPSVLRIAGEKIPRLPRRASGRTSLHANVNVREARPPRDPDSPLAFSMEGYPGKPPPPLITRYWVPGWNSAQAVNKYQREVAGPLEGGDPGVRLIKPDDEAVMEYFGRRPAPVETRPGEWLLAPLYHVLGSEELSMLSAGVASRAPGPYLALCPEDAKSLGVEEGGMVECESGDGVRVFPLRCVEGLPRGVAGFPARLPAAPWPGLPRRGRLRKAGER